MGWMPRRKRDWLWLIVKSLLGLSVIGCQEPTYEDYETSQNNTLTVTTWNLVVDSRRTDVIDSARAWEKALASTCPIKFEINQYREDKSHNIVVNFDDYSADSFGFYEHGNVDIRPNLDEKMLSRVVKHELGHAFGLSHRNDDGIMTSPYHNISKTDVDEYITIHCR